MRSSLDQATGYLLGIGLAAGLALSVGCASPAWGKAMTPTGLRFATVHPYSVVVRVEGGSETDPQFGTAEVSASEFREALVAAIRETQVFRSIHDGPPADYRLTVSVVQSEWKGTFKIEGIVTTRWQLTRLVDGQMICNEFLETSATATMGDAFAGNARVRAAKEKAAQENIKAGLEKIAALGLN